MLRALYQDLAKARSLNRAVTLSRQSRTDLKHFLERIQTWNGRYLTTPSPSVTLTTDASDYGWGMTLANGMSARGFWPNPHAMHITEKELTAVLLALKTIERADPALIKDKTVMVRSDSVATVCQLNNLGGGGGGLGSSDGCNSSDQRRNVAAQDNPPGKAHPRSRQLRSGSPQPNTRSQQVVTEPSYLPDDR